MAAFKVCTLIAACSVLLSILVFGVDVGFQSETDLEVHVKYD